MEEELTIIKCPDHVSLRGNIVDKSLYSRVDTNLILDSSEKIQKSQLTNQVHQYPITITTSDPYFQMV
ncbi:unnamed protein product [Ambrosiozyma monospora]|uniref:Unnamed protein product n=1 Tax=Ambrosiozyma monospora TaxID=43982 RepID=A0ACB5T4T8_AMBMO|nr:unnamed protein product [Ambrosiozyma monospora]